MSVMIKYMRDIEFQQKFVLGMKIFIIIFSIQFFIKRQKRKKEQKNQQHPNIYILNNGFNSNHSARHGQR